MKLTKLLSQETKEAMQVFSILLEKPQLFLSFFTTKVLDNIKRR